MKERKLDAKERKTYSEAVIAKANKRRYFNPLTHVDLGFFCTLFDKDDDNEEDLKLARVKRKGALAYESALMERYNKRKHWLDRFDLGEKALSSIAA